MDTFTKLEHTEEGIRRVGIPKEIVDAKFVRYHSYNTGDSIDIAIAFKRAMEESKFQTLYHCFNWASEPSLVLFKQQVEVWLGVVKEVPKEKCTFVWQGFELDGSQVDCCTIYYGQDFMRNSYMAFRFKDYLTEDGVLTAINTEVIFTNVGDDFSDLLNQFFNNFRDWWASKNRSPKSI